MDEKLTMYSNIKKVKQKVAIFYVSSVLSGTPYLGFIFAIGAMVAQFMFCYDLSKLSQSKSLFRNALVVLACNAFLSLLGIVFTLTFDAESFDTDFERIIFNLDLSMLIFYIMFALILLLMATIFLYFVYKKLSFITNQKFLFLGYILSVLGFGLMTISVFVFLATYIYNNESIAFLSLFIFIALIGVIIGIVGLILQIIGWVNFKDLRNSQNGEWIFKYEWFFMDNKKLSENEKA
ncbi:hypothetical protein [Campylobacter sp. US33a]|uniref:Uncharacterized protein n=1 Tax=Campylobacter sp. CCS1377 TaxID=3158229 RepID=A0AAU7E534_9BACT|nr:hypothetical protein [Campylobacter sp. US33a]MCW1361032.1 hypothetical protein [Campylobacter jejuni]TEY01529.1 hypothetical protein ELQ16_07100 [Campylobacter sp. US33a]